MTPCCNPFNENMQFKGHRGSKFAQSSCLYGMVDSCRPEHHRHRTKSDRFPVKCMVSQVLGYGIVVQVIKPSTQKSCRTQAQDSADYATACTTEAVHTIVAVRHMAAADTAGKL